MKRIQFLELHEIEWMPKTLRNTLTDFLQMLLTHYKVYSPAVPLLAKVIKATKQTKIIDMCSGGSGPILDLIEDLEVETQKLLKIKLTDLNPNLPAFNKAKQLSGGKIEFSDKPIDARYAIAENKGIRTFFSSFHQFNPQDAKAILADVVKSGSAVCIFEFTENDLKRAMKDLLVPLSVLAMMPKVKPFNMYKFLFTYIFPVLPLVITFDSLVSNLRTYSPEQLLEMAKEVDSENYHWESAKITSGFKFFNMTYLIGYPK